MMHIEDAERLTLSLKALRSSEKWWAATFALPQPALAMLVHHPDE